MVSRKDFGVAPHIAAPGQYRDEFYGGDMFRMISFRPPRAEQAMWVNGIYESDLFAADAQDRPAAIFNPPPLFTLGRRRQGCARTSTARIAGRS